MGLKFRIGQIIRVHAFRSREDAHRRHPETPPTFVELAVTETDDRMKRYTGKILRDVVRGTEFTRRVGDTMLVTGENQLRLDWDGRIEAVNRELFV